MHTTIPALHVGPSETSSFTRHLDRQSIRPLRLIDGQRGVIIGIGGSIIGLELFCSGSRLRPRRAGSAAARRRRSRGILHLTALDRTHPVLVGA